MQNHGRQIGINLNNAFGYEYDAVIAYNGSGTGEL